MNGERGERRRPAGRAAAWLGGAPLVCAVWVASRWWALPRARHHYGNDVALFTTWSVDLVHGRYPTHDPSWQYPPLAGPMLALPRWLGMDPEGGLYGLFLLADLGVLVALVVAGRQRRTPLRGTAGAWLWALLPLVIGPILLARFDVVPTLFAVLGLLALTATPSQGRRAGALLGLGAMVKAWPALLVVAAPARAWRRVSAALAVTVLSVLVAVWRWSGRLDAFLGNQAGRGLQLEAVAALPFVVAHAAGAPVHVVHRYGSSEVDAAGAGIAATAASIAAVVLLGWLAWRRWQGRLDAVPIADLALVTVLTAVVTSRVYSPQYNVWIAGVAAVALLDPATSMRRVVVVLAALGGVTSRVYPAAYGSLLRGGATGTILHTVRVALLVTALVLAWRAVLRRAGTVHDRDIRAAAPARRNPHPTGSPRHGRYARWRLAARRAR